LSDDDDGAWGELIAGLFELFIELLEWSGWWALLVLFVLVTVIAYVCQ
jgi:hypothetical protein